MHPNALLILVLTPDDLARKTYRAILEDAGQKDDEGAQIPIGKDQYWPKVMESDYDERGLQVSAKEGDILLVDMVTYGYGEYVTWAELEAQKQALETWAIETCAKHKCSYEIRVGANYW